MNADAQKVLAISQIRALIILANERLGDANPYASIPLKLEDLDISDLNQIRRALHELLYSPPPRQ
jgi:hypothetical protein